MSAQQNKNPLKKIASLAGVAGASVLLSFPAFASEALNSSTLRADSTMNRQSTSERTNQEKPINPTGEDYPVNGRPTDGSGESRNIPSINDRSNTNTNDAQSDNNRVNQSTPINPTGEDFPVNGRPTDGSGESRNIPSTNDRSNTNDAQSDNTRPNQSTPINPRVKTTQ